MANSPTPPREKLAQAQITGIIAGVLVLFLVVVAILAWACLQRRSYFRRQRPAAGSVDERLMALGLAGRRKLFVTNPD